MDKNHWQAATFFSLSLLVLTNAAQFYTRRTLESELASARSEAGNSPRVVRPNPMTGPQDAPDVQYLPGAFDNRPTGKAGEVKPGERCIEHQRFEKTATGWTQLGDC